jgi:hypothetical protein
VTESDFYHEIKRGFSKEVHLQRIENAVGDGVPDVNAFKRESRPPDGLVGIDLWIETKMMRNGRVFVRHSQSRWAWIRCAKHGARNVFFVARASDAIRVWSAMFVITAERLAKDNPRAWRHRETEEGFFIDLGEGMFKEKGVGPKVIKKLEEFLFERARGNS